MDDEYTIGDLATSAGVTPRTIRYYVSSGILPGPRGAGSGARYSSRHLNRLRLVRDLQREHLPLSEIHGRLETLSDEEVASLVARPAARPSQSALEYIRSVLGDAPDASPSLPSPSPAPRAVQVEGREAPNGQLRRLPFAAPLLHARRPVLPSRPAAYVDAGGARRERESDSAPEAAREADPEGALPGAGPMPGVAAGVAAGLAGADISTVAEEPAAYVSRSQWDRIALTANVELHIRRPLSRLENRRVERLLALARQVLREDEQ